MGSNRVGALSYLVVCLWGLPSTLAHVQIEPPLLQVLAISQTRQSRCLVLRVGRTVSQRKSFYLFYQVDSYRSSPPNGQCYKDSPLPVARSIRDTYKLNTKSYIYNVFSTKLTRIQRR